MPAARKWTDVEDGLLREMHAARRTQVEIGAAIGCSRWVARDRLRLLGVDTSVAANGRVYSSKPKPTEPVPANGYRAPLPAGHSQTWGLLTRGTCLEGVAYPG